MTAALASLPPEAFEAEEGRLVFCSDLHLGGAPGDGRYDADFESFLATLRASSGQGGNVRLVLLGDIFDFAQLRARRRHDGGRPTQEQALELVDVIADAHPRVFSALAAHLRAGCDLDVVAGNHDADLAWPAVRARLVERLAPFDPLPGSRERTGAVRFHPWLFYVPGLVYAEHGHQHHDINSFTTVLRPWRRGVLDTSMGEALAAFRHAIDPARAGTSAHPRRARATSAFLRVLASQMLRRSGPWWRLSRIRYRRGLLTSYAGSVGLPASTVRALDALTAHSGPQILGRVLRVAARGLSGGAREDYVYAAARRVSAVLAAAGRPVPYYVFGHTHAAARRPLADPATTPVYLNTGTWSPYRRGADAGEGPTCVVVTLDADRPQAEVYRYDRHSAAPVPLCPATPLASRGLLGSGVGGEGSR